MPRALVVDDNTNSREALAEWLKRWTFAEVLTASSVAEARAAIERQGLDLVLLDLKLPDGSGLELLGALEEQPEADVVVITAHGSVDSAVEAFRGGAIDYLVKPVDLQHLDKLVKKSLRAIELRREVSSLREELRRLGHFGPMIGASTAMQEVYRLISRVAPTSSTVLVLGETGTGKELVAQTVHQLSRRAKGAFLPVNCGAVSPTLIESELFGHERGSFTGAERQRKGIYERAHGGTLFLDEITEMPPELQVKLLRVLETGSFSRVGGGEPIVVDVRVIAATNREPEAAVEAGRLRRDLLYRLNVFPIRLPPLRERADDVEQLAEEFLERLNREAEAHKLITRGALARLRGHAWPGNVRELKNVIERAFIIAGDEIDTDAVPLEAAAPAPAAPAGAVMLPVGEPLDVAEQRLIVATLEHCGGSKKQAAEMLGISLKTLYNKLKGYAAEDSAAD